MVCLRTADCPVLLSGKLHRAIFQRWSQNARLSRLLIIDTAFYGITHCGSGFCKIRYGACSVPVRRIRSIREEIPVLILQLQPNRTGIRLSGSLRHVPGELSRTFVQRNGRRSAVCADHLYRLPVFCLNLIDQNFIYSFYFSCFAVNVEQRLRESRVFLSRKRKILPETRGVSAVCLLCGQLCEELCSF